MIIVDPLHDEAYFGTLTEKNANLVQIESDITSNLHNAAPPFVITQAQKDAVWAVQMPKIQAVLNKYKAETVAAIDRKAAQQVAEFKKRVDDYPVKK